MSRKCSLVVTTTKQEGQTAVNYIIAYRGEKDVLNAYGKDYANL